MNQSLTILPCQRQQTPTGQRISVSLARSYCRRIATSDRFLSVVAYLLLPRRLLMHYHTVAAFCWHSNMLVNAATDARVALFRLRDWREELLAMFGGEATHPITIALHATVEAFAMPRQPFLDLLFAREQELLLTRYRNFEQLCHYCSFAAAPLGHITLNLFRSVGEAQREAMNRIATGLYLTRLWYTVGLDWQRGRFYVPEEDSRQFGYDADDWAQRRHTPALEALMQFQANRTRELFYRALPLIDCLPRDLRKIVETAAATGLSALDDLERRRFNVWRSGPRISWRSKARLLLRAAWPGR